MISLSMLERLELEFRVRAKGLIGGFVSGGPAFTQVYKSQRPIIVLIVETATILATYLLYDHVQMR
jgi:hypothetical protein